MSLSRRGLLGAAALLPASSAFGGTLWPDALVMGTGRPGGYYVMYGREWAKLSEADSDVRIALRASGGATANILLIEQNTVQLGLTTVNVAIEARHGTGAWTAGVKFQSFRALFPMFPSVLQIVSPQLSGITTLAELAGQIVGIGPVGGSGSATVPAILANLGIIPSRVVTGDYLHQVRDMLAGRISVCAFVGAPPLPAITSAATGRMLSLIGLSQAEIEQVVRTSPGMAGMVLEAGTFPGQTTAVASIGTANFAIGSATLPDAVARDVALAALRNQTALAALVPAAAGALQLEPIMTAGITFHPGAADALRSFGLDVPAKYVG